MKKIVFHISAKLASQIEGAIDRWGFANKPEFFRYAAIEFLRGGGHFMPADDTLKEYAKAIRSVQAHKSIREQRMAWYEPVREKESEERAHLYP